MCAKSSMQKVLLRNKIAKIAPGVDVPTKNVDIYALDSFVEIYCINSFTSSWNLALLSFKGELAKAEQRSWQLYAPLFNLHH